jgi:hypothetical protein
MNKKLVLTAILLVVLVSTGTYVGLNTLWPFQPETIKVGETAELTDVLAAELKPAAPSGTPTIIGTTEEIKEAPAPEAAAEAPAAEEAAPAAVEESAAEPQAAAPAAEPAQTTAAAEPAAPTLSSPAPAAAVKPWWRGDIDGELSAVYVGSLANKSAIVVMFNGSFKATDSLNQHARVTNGAGAVSGQWELAPSNKRMAIFPVPAKGRYQLSLQAGLTDGAGLKMKTTQQGAIDVQ